MPPSLQPVRGTHDLLFDEAAQFRWVIDQARAAAERYGFGEIIVPIFEFSEVFHRTLGDSSDVVSKETYSFTDRGGESLTLRPELTAGIARAFISNGLHDQLPCKFFYAGPAFRYERPQKGRMRQFHQIGIELLGAAEVQADIEVIALAAMLLRELGLSNVVTLELNSLADLPSRQAYRAALVDYFNSHKLALSAESQTRLEKNPLRILDSKDAGDRALIAGAPAMQEYYNAESAEFFAGLLAGLDALGIAYTHNKQLVRGLDYYDHTVFEFTTERLGAQNTVLAGGRYNGLIALMGGKDTPGIGFAAGVERLLALQEEVKASPEGLNRKPIWLIPLGDAQQIPALKLAEHLRGQGLPIEMGYRGNLSKRLKKADKSGAEWAILIGEDELARGEVNLRNLRQGSEEAIMLDSLAMRLKATHNSTL